MPTLASEVYLELPPVEPGPPERPNPTRKLRVGGMGPGVRAHFVALLKQRAWDELDRQGPTMPSSRYNRLEAALMQNMGAGKYEWGGEVHDSIDGTRPGLILTLTARLKAHNPFAEEAWAERLIEEYGIERVMAATKEADGPPVPNGRAPAADPSGASPTTPASTATVASGSATSQSPTS